MTAADATRRPTGWFMVWIAAAIVPATVDALWGMIVNPQPLGAIAQGWLVLLVFTMLPALLFVLAISLAEKRRPRGLGFWLATGALTALPIAILVAAISYRVAPGAGALLFPLLIVGNGAIGALAGWGLSRWRVR